MNSPGSGHVHGGREGRMSFERQPSGDTADLLELAEGGNPSLPTDQDKQRQMDDDARAFFRARAEERGW